MRSLWFIICFIAAALGGCAVRSDVAASLSSSASADFGAGSRTYAFSRAAYPAVDEATREYESAIAESLRRHGFLAASEAEARYRVSLSYETHEQSIAVGSGGCSTGSDCGGPTMEGGEGPILVTWPWQRAFVHSLTLRFFDRTNGSERYKVSATYRDHEPSAREALPYLVESALARLPYPADGRWRVKLPGSGVTARSPTISKIR